MKRSEVAKPWTHQVDKYVNLHRAYLYGDGRQGIEEGDSAYMDNKFIEAEKARKALRFYEEMERDAIGRTGPKDVFSQNLSRFKLGLALEKQENMRKQKLISNVCQGGRTAHEHLLYWS